MTSKAVQPLRDEEPVLLGPVESMFWQLEESTIGVFRAVVLFRLDGWIEADVLSLALRNLQHRHPKLRATIVKASDGCFRYRFDDAAPSIPIEIRDCYGGEAPWREETRRMLQIAFPAAGPLAAVTVLRSEPGRCSHLILAVHHAIADGLSAIMLMHDLLTEYAAGEAQPTATPSGALLAVTAGRAKWPGDWRSRFWLLRRFIRLQREERRSRQTSLPEAHDVTPQSQWVHWVFSRDNTLRLVRRCRKEQASLSGALVAATCCGLMDCLPVPVGLFKCQFPFNLRDALDATAGAAITPDDLGCFVSIMNEFYEIGQQSAFWDVARRVHHDTQEFVQHGGPAAYYNLAALMANRVFSRIALRFTDSSKKRVTLLATNYGVLKVRDAYGSLRPRGCTLVFKNDLVGPSIIVEALVMGQQLNIGLAADRLDLVFWNRLHRSIRWHLDTAAGAGESISALP